LNAGITYKLVQFRVDCSGACPANFAFNATSSALDVGAQYDLGPFVPLTVAVAVRNLGPRLQVNDNPQSDPLPARLQFGVSYRVPNLERYARATEVHVTGDLLDEVRIDNPSARVGADVIFQKRFHLRSGYVFDASEAGGPSLGVGLVTGNLSVDVAQLFQGLSAESGNAPFYVSLRYLF
jgi:hypothetical protein